MEETSKSTVHYMRSPWFPNPKSTADIKNEIHNLPANDIVVVDYYEAEEALPWKIEDVSYMRNHEKPKIMIAEVSAGTAYTSYHYWVNSWNKIRPSWLSPLPIEDGAVKVQTWWHPEWSKIVDAMVMDVVNAGFDGVLIKGLTPSKNNDKRIKEYVAHLKSLVKSPTFQIHLDEIKGT